MLLGLEFKNRGSGPPLGLFPTVLVDVIVLTQTTTRRNFAGTQNCPIVSEPNIQVYP